MISNFVSRSYTREDWKRAHRAVRRQRWGSVSCESHFVVLGQYAKHITYEPIEAMVARFEALSLEQIKAERSKREYAPVAGPKFSAVKKMIGKIQRAYGPQIGALMQPTSTAVA